MDIGGIEVIETGSRLLMAEDVAELTEHIEQIESENDKLRSMRDTWQENDAKLRELVRHMYTCMGNVDADGNLECFSCEYEGAECVFADLMSELGIEVDK